MNNYYDLAEDDLLEAKDRHEAGRYNKCAIWCQQASEKYLKYILISKMAIEDSEILTEHRLKILYDRINRDKKTIDIPASALFSLSNYYLKARYPGEGFVEVDRELAARLLRYAEDIKSVVDNYLGFNSNGVDLSSLAMKYPEKR